MKSRKKLLVVIEALQMNGAVKGLLDFVSAVDRSEYDIDLFLFDPERHDGILEPDYVNVLPYDVHCIVERVGLGTALCQALKWGRVDLMVKRVFYSSLQRFSPRFRKWNLARTARSQVGHYDVAIGGTMGPTWEYVTRKVSADRKLLWLDTNVHFEPWPEYWRHFRPFLDEASALVCVSESIRDMMREENREISEKIHTVNYVIDADRITKFAKCPSLLPAKQRFRIVTVGRYCGQKGQYLIPEIASLLEKAGLDFEWQVIAPGYTPHQESIYRSLSDFGVENRVAYYETMSNPFAEMAAADLYVQPSVFEGYGLTVSEALVSGCYVVATDIPEFREQIKNERLGLLAELAPQSFSEKILEAVKRIREGRREIHYQTPYSRELIYHQFVEILNHVSQVKGGSVH